MSHPLPESADDAESDAALISRVRDGDSAAFGELYERHVAAARGLARQTEAEADDAVSETFTRMLALLRRGAGPDSGFRPYLLAAVRHTVYDRFRDEAGPGRWPVVGGGRAGPGRGRHLRGLESGRRGERPNLPLSQTMVLDGTRPVLPGGVPVDIPVDGLLPTAADGTVGLVGWEGDEGLKGDRLTVADRALAPEGGDRDPADIMDSAAEGAIGPALTFGVNVDRFRTVLGARQTLALVTDRDAYLVGAVTVTAPMRS